MTVNKFSEILSTESPEALTGSAFGLKRLRRWATAYIIFHQIVGAVGRTSYYWIRDERLHNSTLAPVKTSATMPWLSQ